MGYFDIRNQHILQHILQNSIFFIKLMQKSKPETQNLFKNYARVLHYLNKIKELYENSINKITFSLVPFSIQ